ncbi:uncharacterized protein LOC130677740 [Microplitis mediator]|uniref:uncharacterized protein LOC130677740 n=1 Tax=Microplitis mediator TaxID=375433 RepID=UPI002555F6A2|nr:uncharacterized protein LOC130677740 [Microplitis mediator]
MAFVIKSEVVELPEEVIVQGDVDYEQVRTETQSIVEQLLRQNELLQQQQQQLEPQLLDSAPRRRSTEGPGELDPLDVSSLVAEEPVDLSLSENQAIEEPVPSTSGNILLRGLLALPVRPRAPYTRWVRCPAPAEIQSAPEVQQEHLSKRKRSDPVTGGGQGAPATRTRPPITKYLQHSGVRVICGDTMAVSVPFRVTFVEGHTFPIPFTDPLVGLLSPMTSVEASWLVAAMPWPLMHQFIFESLLALIVAMCPMHLWELAETSPPRVRIILEELWDQCSARVSRCVYCGNGRQQ